MKFIRTKITVEKLSETIRRSEPASCPNCGHLVLLDEGIDEHRFHHLAVERPSIIKTIEQRENEHE